MNLETATRLAQLRKNNGYSQEALAEKLGISRQAISKWERAESSPDTDNLISLAELYGLTLDELLNYGIEADATASSGAQPSVNTNENTEETAAESNGRFKNLLKNGEKEKKPSLYPHLAHLMFVFPFPLVIAAIFCAIGILSEVWHPTWLLFMLIPVYYCIAIACKTKSLRSFLICMPVPFVIVILYLMLGFFFELWAQSWMLFLLIPIYYWLATAYGKKLEKKRNTVEQTSGDENNQ